MPYIITTKPSIDPGDDRAFYARQEDRDPSITRHAVATLEEARDAAASIVGDYDAGSFNAHCRADDIDAALDTMPESGGTVGPLPDGTTIEVEHVTAGRMTELALGRVCSDRMLPAAIDAFNADV